MTNNKKIVNLLFILVAIFVCSVIPCEAREFYTEFGDTQEVKVYIEKFVYPRNWIFDVDTTYDNRYNYSGWDSDEAGGELQGDYGKKCIFFRDTNSELPVSLKKQFEAATFGVLKLSFCIDIKSYADDFCWTLTDGGVEAMSIVTLDNCFYLKQPGGNMLKLIECQENKEYAFKIDTDMDNKLINVSIDGVLMASSAKFANDVSRIDTLSIQSGRKTVGEFAIYPLSLNRGYVIKESFDVQTNTNLPQPWEDSSNKGSATCQLFKENNARDWYRLRLDSKQGDASATYRFDKLNGKYILDFKQYMETIRDGVSVSVKNGNEKVFSVESKNGTFVFNAQKETKLYEYIEDFWYQIRVIFDLNSQQADVYVNGKLKASNEKINASSADSIVFEALKNTQNNVLYDDILLYPFIERAEDYVEAPVIPEKKSNDVLVGMQACSLWTEGTQCGWELVSHYPLRVPYLGFYDEGNPEVTDWELKWMLEHGIDFQWYCWYRPEMQSAGPIKNTEHTNSILDGLFYSKYGNLMKFAIFYENMNSSFGDANDFRNNIVPYWIEYFFKDDRYLKIDNRPVIGAFGYDKLAASFGGEAGVKAAFEYLEEECEKNGIGKPIWLLSTFDSGTDNFKKYSSAGFSSVYSYHRSNSSMGQLRGYLEKIKNNGYLNVVPSLSVGYNGRTWGQNKDPFRYGLARADEYAELCKWMNDEYLPTLSIEGLDKKLVMIDTWNEYGEGTYVMPTDLNGFGYLDGIRDAFTVGGEHEDVVPTDKQKDRFNNLYPDIEVKEVFERYPERLVPTGIAASWNFADSDAANAWKARQDIKELTVKDGKLNCIISGGSACIEIDNLNIDVTDVPFIKIRMKNNTPSIGGRIEFIKDGSFLSDQSVSFISDHNAKEYEDIYVKMYRNNGWNGVIDGIRIYLGSNGYFLKDDPNNSFEIEEITFLSGDAADTIEGIKYRLDGVVMECSNPTPVYNDGSICVPVADLQKMFDTILRWDNETKTTHIVKKDKFSISMKINDNCIYLDGVKFNGCKGAIIHNNRTFVPIEVFAAIGYDVEWDEEENTISIDSIPERIENDEGSALKRKVIKGFEFNYENNLEGWNPIQQITNLQTKKGIMSASIHGTDPYMELGNFEGFDASSIKNISIRYQNNTEAPLAQIFFQTDSSAGWTATKAINFDVPIYQSEYSVYNIDPRSNPEWTGKITQLRFDPAGWTTGGFKVDYIRFEGDFQAADANKYVLPQISTNGSDITILQNGIKWNFDTNHYADGWELNKSLGDVDINQGYLSARVVGNTPALRTRSALNVDASKVRSIGVKLKNKTVSEKAKLYFTTNKKSDISEERCAEIMLVPNDPIGKLYILKTEDIVGWGDQIKDLYLEFEGEQGNIVLEYIKLNFYK